MRRGQGRQGALVMGKMRVQDLLQIGCGAVQLSAIVGKLTFAHLVVQQMGIFLKLGQHPAQRKIGIVGIEQSQYAGRHGVRVGGPHHIEERIADAVKLRIALNDVAFQLPINVAIAGQAEDLIADFAEFALGAFAELLFHHHVPKSIEGCEQLFVRLVTGSIVRRHLREISALSIPRRGHL